MSNQIICLRFFCGRIQIMTEFYIGIPITFVHEKFTDGVGACFSFSLIQNYGRLTYIVHKPLIKQTFSHVFRMFVFNEKRIAKFLVSHFGGICHVFIQNRIIFRVGCIIHPKPDREKKKLFFIGFLAYIIRNFII